MSVNTTRPQESDGSIDLDNRDARALTEPLSVVTLDGMPVDDETVVSVVSHSGENHTVDVVEGRCTCKDAEYNLPDGDRDVCKHVERARASRSSRSMLLSWPGFSPADTLVLMLR